jgi:hypothetical protein
LTRDRALVLADGKWIDVAIELVRFGDALFEDLFEIVEWRSQRPVREPQS